MRQIKGVAKNNVQVLTSEERPDIDGNIFHVWAAAESYGQVRIDDERAAAEKALETAQAIDANQYKEDRIAEANERLETLDLIQDEMDLMAEEAE